MARRSIAPEEKLRECDLNFQKIQQELKVVSDAGIKAQRLALSRSKEARSCRQQL